MSTFKDHFSTQSADYVKYRPQYPEALFQFILSQVKHTHTAWDCATGNGQVAVVLADHFDEVYATDASANQIEHAVPNKKVSYSVATAEHSGLPDNSVDLIAVGQAIHWFDHLAFYKEAERVAKTGCLLAAWGYGYHKVSPAIDEVVQYYSDTYVGKYWPPERKHIDNAYADIPFPYAKLEIPEMYIELQMTLDGLIGYLRTWSSTQGYIKATGHDPLLDVTERLTQAWGDATEIKTVKWPIIMMAGYVK